MSKYAENFWWFKNQDGNLTIAEYDPAEKRWFVLGDELTFTDAEMIDWEKISQVVLPQVSS
jgi:hypothetical protein